MKTRIIFLLLVSALTATISCDNKNSGSNNHKIIVDTTVMSNSEDTLNKAAAADTVQINYQANKDILDLIPLIPDSAMQSWKWSKADRDAFLSMVKTHNFFTDTNPRYNTIKKVLPHYFETQVVDGLFSMACYKADNGDVLLITNDKVGDGNYLCAYRVSENKITAVSIDDVRGSVESYLKIYLADDEKCSKQLEDAAPYSSYDLANKNEISIAVPLKKEESVKCVKGNVIKLQFNAATCKFGVSSITWDEVN